MYKILLVEDDPSIALSVKQHLAAWGFDVICADDFSNITQTFLQQAPQLVLMDISLPFFNGYHWCSEIRKLSKVPIVFISSAAENMNIVMAINMGADDFIAKPFDTSVLLAKVQAILRRTYDFTGETTFLQHKGAVLQSNDTLLQYQNQSIPLTKNEYRILHTLLEQKGTVVSRERLMEALWHTDSFVDENTLTVNVNRLRKKLEQAGLADFIQTKFGVGYLIT